MVKKDFKIIYLLLLFIILFTPKVYASEFNMNSYTSATKDGTKNRYNATEIYQTGLNGTYTFNTRYNGRISYIKTFFDYPFSANLTYRLTYNMATEDFRNNFGYAYWWDCDDSSQVNPYRSSITYVSYKKIQVSFKPLENTTCIRMDIQSPSVSNTAFTGVNNWNLSSITIYDPEWQSGSGSGQGTSTPSPTSTPNSNQDIINNQNNNTQDIINNNTQNTQDIIENNNQNTKDIINNQNELLGDCITNIWNGEYVNGYLSQQANNSYIYSASSGTRTIVVSVSPNTTYTIQKFPNTGIGTRFVVGGSNTALNFGDTMPYFYYDNSGASSTTITTNSNTNYLYIYLTNNSSNIPFVNVIKGTSFYSSYLIDKVCQSKLDSTNNAINGLNDSINNDNVDSGTGSSFFNDFNTSDNGGISAIVTKPLTIVNQLLTNNGQCTNLQLPTILGVDGAYFPSGCILWDNATPVMVSLWNAFVCGLASYYILKDLFVIVENLKDPENDKVEVIDL